jgi:hypothetical protein
VRIVTVHQALESRRVGDDRAVESGGGREVGDAAARLAGCRAGEVGVVMTGDGGQEEFAAGKCLFGLDFGAEA